MKKVIFMYNRLGITGKTLSHLDAMIWSHKAEFYIP